MSTHNIYFPLEIIKISILLFCYDNVSGAMLHTNGLQIYKAIRYFAFSPRKQIFRGCNQNIIQDEII